MYQSAPPPPEADPAHQLSQSIYRQLVHTLMGLLPPPLAATSQAMLDRNHAALSKVADMLPVNSDEADLAAQCVAARAQAEHVMRSIRAHTGDLKSLMQLNAQYVAMVRTSLSVHNHLLRAQAIRHKRESSDAALGTDAWTRHIAGTQMRETLPEVVPVPRDADAAPVRQPVLAATGNAGPPSGPAMPIAPAAAPAAPGEALSPAPACPPLETAGVPAPAPAGATPVEPRAASFVATPAWTGAGAIAPPPVQIPLAPLPPMRPPAPPAAPRRRRAKADIYADADADDLPRDLAAEAEYYAAVYPRRARRIRQYGALPPDCDFGPPDDDLVRAIVTGISPALRAVDGIAAV